MKTVFQRLITFLANFFRSTGAESAMRLYCFITVVCGNMIGLVFVGSICWNILKGKCNIDFSTAAILLATIVAWIATGITGKYYNSKIENTNTSIDTSSSTIVKTNTNTK